MAASTRLDVPMSGARASDGPRRFGRIADYPGALARSSAFVVSVSSVRRVTGISSFSCASDVALAIGAATPGRAISQANANCAGVTW
jgi:hypothetical protein